MSQFRIEKVRYPVELTLAGGHRLEGKMFLEQSARWRSGPQDPHELLDNDDNFFPLADAADRPVLVAKDQVMVVRYEMPEVGFPATRSARVAVVLADGTQLDGDIEVEIRSDAERLLDALNRDGSRFMAMRMGSATSRCLVNRRMIVSVRQR